jgi:pyruvate formate lyase activating enzyme
VGERVSVDEVLHEVEKDREFYSDTGGLTVSGGEPFAQPVFLHTLLNQSQDAGFHTTVDTSGYVDSRTLTKTSSLVDLFLYDLKIMDSTRHQLHTGVHNKLIVKNLRTLDKLDKPILIRFPLIPRINSSEDNIVRMCKLLSKLRNVRGVSVLPYHRLGVDKARRLGKVARVSTRPSTKLVSHSVSLIQSFGLPVSVE